MELIPFVIERTHQDGWSWKSFLEPLNIDSKPEPSHRIVESLLRPFDTELVSRFSVDLTAQHNAIKQQNAAEAEKAEKEAEEDLRNLVGWNVDLRELGKTWKKYERALMKSLKVDSDLNRSGSAWKVKMLECYIQRQDIGFVQPERLHIRRNSLITDETFQKIVEKVHLSIQAISGWSSNEDVGITALPKGCTESDTRMIIDAILQQICVQKEVVLRTEQTVKSSYSEDSDLPFIELPTNKYDYIMYHHGAPVGVVEAKRQGCLKDDSVAQLLVQLLLLSSKEPSWFYFGVLSDAYRFVFAGVSKQKVWFFQTDDSQLVVFGIQSYDHIKAIVEQISWLIDLAIDSNERSIEAFLNP